MLGMTLLVSGHCSESVNGRIQNSAESPNCWDLRLYRSNPELSPYCRARLASRFHQAILLDDRRGLPIAGFLDGSQRATFRRRCVVRSVGVCRHGVGERIRRRRRQREIVRIGKECGRREAKVAVVKGERRRARGAVEDVVLVERFRMFDERRRGLHDRSETDLRVPWIVGVCD